MLLSPSGIATIGRDGGVVTQRIANPCTRVRFSFAPPDFKAQHPYAGPFSVSDYSSGSGGSGHSGVSSACTGLSLYVDKATNDLVETTLSN